MFYKMITNKRDIWLKSHECSITRLLDYIITAGHMRDAQIDAIKTYLFLKIACENKPLHMLFSNGAFNTIDLEQVELKSDVKNYLEQNPATWALFEYANIATDNGDILAPNIANAIRNNPYDIDSISFFKNAFYNVNYSDYLFSLPMGAGKTYLMAAFIYLDLYFAQNEPSNKAFAHNFIIFAPSGLKTSVVPSLRTIQNFNPSWILPEPTASDIKRKLIFEVLDENKTSNKSNKTKNPNVQKIAIHQPIHELFGLVAVTNAEKVILDRIKVENDQIKMFEDSTDDKDRQANELRNLLGKLPQLSIFIDEVHHAATDDKKLRAVVNKWMENDTVNSVIGFSGTPYLQKKEKITVNDKLSISNIEISNNVYYYPLVNGIGNFLKQPTVKISNSKNRLEIVDTGVREFLDTYKDKVYYDGTCAKLAIFCGQIATLEEEIYPLVSKIASEHNLSPSEVILRFHGGSTDKKYSTPVDSDLHFASLDKPFSKVKIILLVQIGKEGWDCKSLTGVILSQEGDCSTNMVLQTSCRCLRQVEKDTLDTALIYLNEFNANILDLQLKKQHNISIKEFEQGVTKNTTTLLRYDRTKYLKLPKVNFYQLKVSYTTLIVDEELNTDENINDSITNTKYSTIIKEANFETGLQVSNILTEANEKGDMIANFNIWIYEIAKESFGFINIKQLLKYSDNLKTVFNKITYTKNDIMYFSSQYNLKEINSAIRKAFYEKRTYEIIEELIPEQANLLNIDNFKKEIQTSTVESFYPKQDVVDKIILGDKGKLKIDQKMLDYIKMCESMGDHENAEKWKSKTLAHPMKDHSFHYLPYKTDSTFEITFLDEVLKLDVAKNVEVYYNGDRALTEFKIKCYKQKGTKWQYIGMYTPDFLIIKRKCDEIYKIVIVETKGKIYANDPTFKDKRVFMETAFKSKNNEQFGYNRFEYLYLEDSLSETDRILATADIIQEFFKDDSYEN